MLDIAVARARKQATLARTQMINGDNRLAIATLARAFHALAKADGLDPWDPDLLYRWSIEHLHTGAERHCARFILGVWNRPTSKNSTPRMTAGSAASMRSEPSLRGTTPTGPPSRPGPPIHGGREPELKVAEVELGRPSGRPPEQAHLAKKTLAPHTRSIRSSRHGPL